MARPRLREMKVMNVGTKVLYYFSFFLPILCMLAKLILDDIKDSDNVRVASYRTLWH